MKGNFSRDSQQTRIKIEISTIYYSECFFSHSLQGQEEAN